MFRSSSLPKKPIISIVIVLALVVAYFCLVDELTLPAIISTAPRSEKVWEWINNPQDHQDWMIKALTRCADAPFVIPTDGFIGFLWNDSFRPGHRHQGIDIFGGQEVGITPIYAAYSGYLTRQADWKATLIIRIPADPLNPHRQIWSYYTHMADASGTHSYIASDFPAGVSEVFVEQGRLLGYQGNYSGNAYNPVGVHLHFSIVADDGEGHYLNELDIENTYDPSPYFGLPLNANTNRGELPVCPQ